MMLVLGDGRCDSTSGWRSVVINCCLSAVVAVLRLESVCVCVCVCVCGVYIG